MKKTKTVFRPADPRYTLNEIVEPIYMTIEQWECGYARYLPDIRSRVIIAEFVEEEDDS